MLLGTQQNYMFRQLLSLRHLQEIQGSNSSTRTRLFLAEQSPNRPAKCMTWRLNQGRYHPRRDGLCFRFRELNIIECRRHLT